MGVFARAARWAAAAVVGAVLGGCGGDGDTGSSGPPGPPGTPVVTSATTLNAEITGVTIASPPVVEFTLTDGAGIPFVGLQSARFTIAKLIPGTDGGSSAWQSYVNNAAEPEVGSGTQTVVQATTDRGGTLVDHGDGSYTYTFGTDITNVTEPLAVPYEPALTHRVGMQISGGGLPTVNETYTWQPSTGATSGIATRDVVKVESCNECHNKLAFHGGGRIDTKLCVTCHNPGTTDPDSGHTVDFKVMIHKLHRGANLPSVQAGEDYVIYGYRNTPYNFSHVEFPQDIRNCTKCHDGADGGTPDGDNWRTKPSLQACGSCHDDVDFALGVDGGHPGGVMTDNSQCLTCHRIEDQPDASQFKSIAQSHAILTEKAAERFAFNVLGVTNSAPGQSPVVTFSVTDPTNGDAPYDILQHSAWGGGGGSLNVRMAWVTSDYGNAGAVDDEGEPLTRGTAPSVSALANAVDNGDGTFSVTMPPIPANVEGSAGVAVEGRAAVDVDGDGSADRVSVRQAVDFFPITGSLEPRRTVVSGEKCASCHENQSFHGGTRMFREPQLCVMCHNPNRPNRDDTESNDFKRMIHGYHARTFRETPRSRETGPFPGIVSDCATCHEGDSYYPLPVGANLLGSSISGGADATTAADDVKVTPRAAACSSCHDDFAAQVHMEQNGAGFAADQSQIYSADNPMGSLIETCEVCHGPGTVADVKTVHGFD